VLSVLIFFCCGGVTAAAPDTDAEASSDFGRFELRLVPFVSDGTVNNKDTWSDSKTKEKKREKRVCACVR
jgi:hypothetical protein